MKLLTNILFILLCSLPSFGQENGVFQSLDEALKQKENVISLNLQHQNLTEVPIQIAEFKNLKILDLSYNKIAKIDTNTKFPATLEVLILANNTIVEFRLAYLKNLRSLSLSNNRIRSINDNIGQFSQLTQLRLDQNQLETIPNSICNLQRLYWLFLNDNLLTTLPKNIGNLKTLQLFSASRNDLKTIPSSITKLKNLTVLEVSNNSLTEIPKNLINQKLESISLSHNRLEHLEYLLPNKTTTVTIDLRYNLIGHQLELLKQKFPNAKIITRDKDLIIYEVPAEQME